MDKCFKMVLLNLDKDFMQGGKYYWNFRFFSDKVVAIEKILDFGKEKILTHFLLRSRPIQLFLCMRKPVTHVVDVLGLAPTVISVLQGV